MKRNIAHAALAVAAFGLLNSGMTSQANANTASDIAALKARLKQLESQVAKEKRAEEKLARNVNNAAKVEVGKEAPPPVFIDLRKGLFLETEDKQWAFKIGGRLILDGGGISNVQGTGYQGDARFNQSRLEVEGKMHSWFYKLQYDFSGLGTGSGYVGEGWRDAFVGIQDGRLNHPLLAQPVYFRLGNMYESFSLEALDSTKYRDTIERPMAVNAIAPFRHYGADFGLIGKNNWTGHFGLYTVSPQDLSPLPAQFQSPGNPYALNYYGLGANNKSWNQPYGGGAYWEATGRVTHAPVFDEHRLVHLGVAGSFHQPNSSTGATDNRNMLLGSGDAGESGILNQRMILTPDLSCGNFIYPQGLPSNWNRSSANGNCVNNIEKFDAEFALSYYNLFLQGEYLMSNYNRNTSQAWQYAMAQGGPGSIFLSPMQSRYVAQGGYLQGEWWITGEEKSQSYDQTDKNGVAFAQLKIKDRFSNGGWGAWGLVGRYSVFNANNGPFQGQNLYNNMALATIYPNGQAASNPMASVASANYIANSGIYGGYQQNVTGGVNWYPDNGIAFQANVTKVLAVKAPLAGLSTAGQTLGYSSGQSPTILQFRTKLYF